MNPFTYIKFKEDMLEAVQRFVIDTDYFIKTIDDGSIVLSNNKKNIIFYLETSSLNSEIKNIDGTAHFAIYELFERENIMSKYPATKIPDNLTIEEYSKFYEEWNKKKVITILGVLMTNLKKYI